MAEVFRYQSGLPSISQILDMLERWGAKEELSDEEKALTREELVKAMESLEGKDDVMSQMVRGQVKALAVKLNA